MISAGGDSLKVDADHRHHEKHDRQNERNREGDDGAGAQAKGDQADAETDRDGFPERLHEVVDRVFDRDWLVGDERRLDADGQIRLDVLHSALDVTTQGEDVASGAHGDGEPDAVPPIDAKDRLRRIGRTALDLRDVAEPNEPSVGDEIDSQKILLVSERAGDSDEDFFVVGLHHALRRNRVLCLERGDQRRARSRGPPIVRSKTRRRSARPGRRARRSWKRPGPGGAACARPSTWSLSSR